MDSKLLLQLREATGAPITACRQAILDTKGDVAHATDILRKKGLESAAKKAGRTASEGIIDAYIHPNKKVGVLIEVNCETDFVARTAEFQEFVHDLALQIAATSPVYVRSEDIPPGIVDEQKVAWAQEFAGKPPAMVEKIMQGKLQSWYAEICLMQQPYLKDEGITIEELLKQKIAKLGEHVSIKRFARFNV